MKKENILKKIPNNLKEELFEDILVGKNFKVERIVSEGHTSPETGWYDQESNEWVMVVQGEAILSFENAVDIKLKEGDYIKIPAFTKHRVSYTSKEPNTVWLAIHY